jgi:hypothetical protein
VPNARINISSNIGRLCSRSRDTGYLCGSPTATPTICDEMSLPSGSNGDWRAYIPSSGAIVIVPVVPGRCYLLVDIH